MSKKKNKPLDLFKIEVDESLFHPNFKQTIIPGNKAVRDVLTQWADGFKDRDGKLAKEFQTTYNSVFWELYLFNLFKHWGLSDDFRYDAPDFNINEFNGICVEAVTASNALDSDPEWINSGKEPEFINLENPDEHAKFVKESTIRLANAIFSKLTKFKKSYAELEHVKSKPFIIALAPFDRPFFYIQTSQAISLLLYGKWIRRIDETTGRFENLDFIQKENGADINLGIFNNDSCSEISAIIFSNVATFGKVQAMANKIKPFPAIFQWVRFNKNVFGNPHIGASWGKDYDESIEDGISILLNPFADHPVPEDFVKKFQTIHRSANDMDSADNSLLARMTQRITLRDDDKNSI
ncbi:hypothetical protein [Sphaerochaeta globosa]|uniref:Glycosaminoglycan attachment site n=1 Tax=Sphaerochaeta globosa (strain ATCC BAA-1886 / DSM 22777 / Buddy) TaxID=158189 RepID=F0RTL5_SPHGB|nr:hypothetical protein [Sphaerochaeta globosa]ADY14149.1 hypothetical protein SpiBuddy_2331 [Sphaerochaeta globosa str. Buddy]